MSNNICIEPTEFTDVRTGEKSYGARIYDNYCQSYDNTWPCIPNDDMEVLKLVLNSEIIAIKDTMDWIAEQGIGIHVGNTYFEWDAIKELFE